MVALNVAPDEDGQLPAWRKAGKYTFPILLTGTEDFARALYRVTVAPTNLLLNGEGKAFCRYLGSEPGSELVLEAELRVLLGLEPLPR